MRVTSLRRRRVRWPTFSATERVMSFMRPVDFPTSPSSMARRPQRSRGWAGRRRAELVMSDHWHYADGGKTVGPLDFKEMRIALSKISDPRNLMVWKIGFKDWQRAEDVPELAE